jgi:hypothetical protein
MTLPRSCYEGRKRQGSRGRRITLRILIQVDTRVHCTMRSDCGNTGNFGSLYVHLNGVLLTVVHNGIALSCCQRHRRSRSSRRSQCAFGDPTKDRERRVQNENGRREADEIERMRRTTSTHVCAWSVPGSYPRCISSIMAGRHLRRKESNPVNSPAKSRANF